ncbi:lipoprotein NlpI [Rubripirellula amarantea]|uniref:Lipoprotein NlpI n=1 Tax=Rubripirellula amarantea TaxID=2527999 RepID=A0A5C5WUU2_9BACT|nr:tetratricopeptide repeat protein [Rubripirellula amarantea]TWT54378.1 lipoprotein NlpI [Rubripirellula amarantea]
MPQRIALRTFAFFALLTATGLSSMPADEADEATVQSELERIDQSLSTMSTDDFEGVDSVRKLVKQAFDLQMKLQAERIERAELDLARVKQQYAERLNSSDEIVERKVIELTKVAESDNTMPASLLSTEGWKAWGQRDYRTALTRFEAALKKDPKYIHAINGLGWTHIHLQEYDKAIEIFKSAMKLDPNHGGVTNGLGQALMLTGRFDEAEAMLTEATEFTIKVNGEAKAIQLQITASWFGLVETLMRQKKYDAVIEWTERYLKHDPENERMKDYLEKAQANK